MKCPQCQSTSYRKNGRRNGRQNYLCKNCGRQFLETASYVLSTTEISALPVAADLKDLNSQSMIEVTDVTETNHQLNLPSDLQIDEPILVTSETVISVLLLDAENLKLDQNAENFLSNLAQSPQLIKFAFANWRNASLGKQDVDLYDRGYQLIHVPNGKNSADAKMIAFGASIFKPYPQVKEVFICSSDGLLMHLCHQLQNQGMIVHWVRRQNTKLIVENRNNGETKHYSISLNTEIPALDILMKQLEKLIQSERESIDERISKIAALSALFQARCNIVQQEHTINEESNTLVSNTDSKNNLTTEESLNYGEIVNHIHSAVHTNLNGAANNGIIIESIDSKEKLEKALIQLIKKMKSQNIKEDICTNTLTKEFINLYGKPPSSVIKALGLGSTLSKFLKSCNRFKLQQKGNQYKIELA